MKKAEIIALLESNQNEKGMEKWNARYANKNSFKSYGIGLTVLRKLAKKVGRDHALAQELWPSDIYDVKIMALLIDEPKRITREQVEAQVEQLNQGHLAHVFSSCDAALAKTSFAAELADDWVQSNSRIRKSCGYGLLYEIAKSKKKTAPDDAFFLRQIDYIRSNFANEHISVQGSMGGALLGIGKRNAVLNMAALELARELGPIHFETDSGNCEPLNVVKHLTSDYIKKRLGL